MFVPPDIAGQAHEELQNAVIDQLNKLRGRIRAGSLNAKSRRKEEKILTRWTLLDTHQASRQSDETGVLALLQSDRSVRAGLDRDAKYNPAESIAPIFPLSRLFDDKHLPMVMAALDQLLSSTSSRSTLAYDKSSEFDLVAIHRNESIPGVLALLRAVMRLDLWNSRGWVEVEQPSDRARFRRNWV